MTPVPNNKEEVAKASDPKGKEEADDEGSFNENNDNNSTEDEQFPIQREPFSVSFNKLKQEASEKKIKELEFGDLNSDFNIKLFKEALKNAPERVHLIINYLLKPNANKKAFRYLMLAGPSGVGKSILARAIAWRLGRDYLFVPAPVLLAHYANHTAENLHKLYASLSKFKNQPVLIVDEMNVLTDNHNQEHSDGGNTAMAKWTLLDKQKNNDNFLMIATSNVTNKMPHQLQTRFTNKIINIENPISYASAIQFFLDDQKIVTVAPSCDNIYLEKFSKSLNKLCLREVEALVEEAILRASGEPDSILHPKHFDLALAYTLKHRIDFCDYTEHVKDEERRHKESLKQNKDQFEETQRINAQQFEKTFKQNSNQFAQSNLTQIKIAYLNRARDMHGKTQVSADHYTIFFPELHEPIAEMNMPREANVHYAHWKQ
jgi:AAA+ superfamily predicted ATPase